MTFSLVYFHVAKTFTNIIFYNNIIIYFLINYY